MLDTGRKFFPVEAICELLTVLQQNNFNVFHWHIFDAESFPIHVPECHGLTDASLQHSHSSRCYTAQDIAHVISHAQRLGILVYPETDVPGHCDIWYVTISIYQSSNTKIDGIAPGEYGSNIWW
jgi:hexosaminidase